MHFPVRVLFVCYRNATRSQIATTLLRRLGGDRVEVYSAGIQPEPFDPLAIEVMADIGLDISGQMSKSIEHFLYQEFDYIIMLCDLSQAYVAEFPDAPIHLCWPLPDPAEFQGSPEDRRALLQHMYVELTGRIRRWLSAIPEYQPLAGQCL
ncbi:MAG: arsenate reductase ArsC [Gammaproteobacteria bacterium]|nr:arsenate reductase ArsC [Gammaproteobacteria bacterium]MCP5423892.1 arsenate reductase ArsC [Gammaproteobacteria bacterium]